jgi:hypothetical protein
MISGGVVADVKLSDSGRVYSDLEFDSTTFRNCSLAGAGGSPRSVVVQRVSARACTLSRCHAYRAFFDDVQIDGLVTEDSVQLSGCVFRHVVLRGNVGEIFLHPSQNAQESVDQEALQMYADIDWAMDISEARFGDTSLYYLPGDLVRRNPEEQFLLRRETFTDIDRGTLPSFLKFAVRRFKFTPFSSMVTVAPQDPASYREYLTQMQEMRARGLVE